LDERGSGHSSINDHPNFVIAVPLKVTDRESRNKN
jgi:hypothetical protein